MTRDEALARLQGLRRGVLTHLNVIKARYFDPPRVLDLFTRYVTVRDELRAAYPTLFDDLPVREIPKSSGTTDFEGRGWIGRSPLEGLRDDLQYCIDLLSGVRTMAVRSDAVRPNAVFLVHGHDLGRVETVARFLEKLGLDVVVLKEQPNQGQTVIEKFERHADVGFAVVLMTPDDLGKAAAETELHPRARQNVLLELGYFMARLGRARVCALHAEGVEIPSDYSGVLWISFDPADGWRASLVKELKAAGLQFDPSRAFD
jgi:predicted nucleotide-binding protein